MSRIFASLAVVALALMVTAMGLGLGLNLNGQVDRLRNMSQRVTELEATAGARSEVSDDLRAARLAADTLRSDLERDARRSSLHRLSGVSAALGVLLVSSIAVTYFIGTSRWCREVSEAYPMKMDLARQSQALKRRSFPWALAAMLTVLAVSALGAAADPGTGSRHTALWAAPHLIAALTGLAVIGGCFFVLWMNITRNHRIIELILQRVEKVRANRAREVAVDEVVA